VGNKKRLVPLRPVAHALGAAKAEALPGFHAFSGADTTGRFAAKGRLSCLQALSRCPAVVVSAFVALGTSEELKPDTESSIETFVCQLYEPGTTAVDVAELRQKLFTKKQLKAQKLLPTRGALHEAIAQAHYQDLVWYHDDIPYPQIPPATECGWKEEGDRLVPVPTRDSLASASITHLIKCGCKKTSCTFHCSCRSQRLNCSEMCMCGADEKMCSNISQELLGIDDDDDDDDDPDIKL